MKFCYNENGGLVNGVIFYFEVGDEPLVTLAQDVISESRQTPTTIYWAGQILTKENLARFNPVSLKESVLGIRLTMEDEPELLKDFLKTLGENESCLSEFTDRVQEKIFGNGYLN